MNAIFINGLPRSGNNLLKNILLQGKNCQFYNVYEEFKFKGKNIISLFHPTEYLEIRKNLKNVMDYKYTVYCIYLKRKNFLNCAISMWLTDYIFTDFTFKSDTSILSKNKILNNYNKYLDIIYSKNKNELRNVINNNISNLYYYDKFYKTMYINDDIPSQRLCYYYEDLVSSTNFVISDISEKINYDFCKFKIKNIDIDSNFIKIVSEIYNS